MEVVHRRHQLPVAFLRDRGHEDVHAVHAQIQIPFGLLHAVVLGFSPDVGHHDAVTGLMGHGQKLRDHPVALLIGQLVDFAGKAGGKEAGNPGLQGCLCRPAQI